MSSKQIHLFRMSPEDYGGKVPYIVKELIEQLDIRKCNEVEGIFRLNGSHSRTIELIELLDKETVIDWTQFKDIHLVSTALKRYFRGLGEDHQPLIPFELFPCIIGVMQSREEEAQINTIRETIKSLTRPRLITLAYLCRFLFILSQSADVNHMTSSNLAICIAPNIIVAPDDNDSQAVTNSYAANSAFALMIAHYEVIFQGVELGNDDICTCEEATLLLLEPYNYRYIEGMADRCRERKRRVIPYAPRCRVDNIARPTREPPVYIDLDSEKEEIDLRIYQSIYNEEFLTQFQTQISSSMSERRTSMFVFDDNVEEDTGLSIIAPHEFIEEEDEKVTEV